MTASDSSPAQNAKPPYRKLRWVGRFCWAALLVLMLAAGACALGLYLVYDYVTAPGAPLRAVDVVIPPGSGGHQIAAILAEYELVKHPVFYRVARRLDGAGDTPFDAAKALVKGYRPEDKVIQHGTYTLYDGESPLQTLHRLYEGPRPPDMADAYRLTVPEGLTLEQTAALFDDPDAFVSAARNPRWIARVGIDADSLEGFLMPNTYFFDDKPSEEEVVRRMIEQFEQEWDRIVAAHPGAADMDLMELATVASLIEEEARADEERPLVASVLYNRLERGMPLEMDATLQYALGKYGQRMLDRDKEVDSPYNTYKHAGLPPGPISNPGPASFEAAVAPAETDYLFFVSNADGRTHTFSRTLQEHNRAVQAYRRAIREQRRERQ